MLNDLAIKKANVTISISGLALSHYKEDLKRWETRFLRQVPGHNLTVTVKKNDAVIFNCAIEEKESISIASDSAETVPPRYNMGDDKDLSHIVDFNVANLIGKVFKFKPAPMTVLSIANACFYTKTLSTRQYTIQKNGKALFTRRIGVITGGDIICLGKTELKFANNPENNQTLTAEPGVVYEIIFDNNCPEPPTDGSSDFDKYCEYIETKDKFTLVSTASPSAAKDGDPPTEKEPPCASGQGGESGGGG